MLRINLSTHPFYNERAVTLVLAVLVIVVLALTAVNVTRVVGLTRSQADVRAATDTAERDTRELRQKAAAARGSVDQARLGTVRVGADAFQTLVFPGLKASLGTGRHQLSLLKEGYPVTKRELELDPAHAAEVSVRL